MGMFGEWRDLISKIRYKRKSTTRIERILLNEIGRRIYVYIYIYLTNKCYKFYKSMSNLYLDKRRCKKKKRMLERIIGSL